MNKFLLAIIGISFNLNATEPTKISFGRIVDLKGSGFISFNGKTREITKGDSIEMGSQIVIEHHGQVTFTDNADHRFHLGNSSSVSVSSKNLELRSGDLWFQSLNKNDDYKITTANAMVNYQGGEAILSYDSAKGKSQLMVINGMMKLSNLRAPDLNLSVSEGHFSFIDNAYDEGAPRDPTSVGAKTYVELIGLFSGIAPMDKNSAMVFNDHGKSDHAKAEHATTTHTSSRSIASVNSENPENKMHVDQNLLEDYKTNLLDKSTKKVTNKLSSTKFGKKKVASGKMDIHIYGLSSASSLAPSLAPSLAVTSEKMSSTEAITKPRSRAPASVLEQDVPDGTKEEEENSDSSVSPYSKYFKNPKKDSDKLIDDLKKL